MAFKNFVRFEGYTRAGVKAHILHVLRLKSRAPGEPLLVEPEEQDKVAIAEKLQEWADESWRGLKKKAKTTQVLQEIVLSAPRGQATPEEIARWARDVADRMGIEKEKRVILIHTDESHPHAHVLFPRMKRWRKEDIHRLHREAIQAGRELGIDVRHEGRGRKRIPFRAYMAGARPEMQRVNPAQARPYRWAKILATVNQLDVRGLQSLLARLGYLPGKASGTLLMRVPWREDRNPSLSWFFGKDSRWRWKDHGTGECGDVIDFLRKAEDLSYPEAAARIEEALARMEEEIPQQVPQKAVIEEIRPAVATDPVQIWKKAQNPSPHALAYWLTRHGFPEEMAQKMAGWEPLRKQIGLWKGWILLPYIQEEENEVVGICMRSPLGKKRDMGRKVVVQLVFQGQNMWIVEGIRDALALVAYARWREKRPGDILVTGGNPSQEGMAEIAFHALTHVSQGGKVFLALDADECGNTLAEEIGQRLARNGLAPTKDFVRRIPPYKQKDWFSALLAEWKASQNTHEPEVEVAQEV